MNKILLICTLLLLSLQGLSAKMTTQEESKYKNAVVKIFTVANEPNYYAPWSSTVSEFSGSGCIISGQRILTNAHVVTDSTYIEVLKNGEIKRYEAEVLSIDYETDLALISVKDKSFFNHTKSLDLGELPQLQKEVTVYGFPMGGETLSITKGVVSRIEHQTYVYSHNYFLSIQIDAAINYGNSGGPALSDGKIVGIVMQGDNYGENMGYIIPTSVIKHFLKDIKDRKYDGYPTFGAIIQTLESPVIKDMYGLKDKKYGVLINKTIPNSPASRVLKTGDILIGLDKYKIFSNGKVEFRNKEFTDYSYVLDQHQMYDNMEVTILRDRKEMNLSVTLDKKYNELMFSKSKKPNTRPTYFIYGGLVFVPSLDEYSIPSKYYKAYPNKEREELVILNRILSSSLTKGSKNTGLYVIETVNGKKFKNFKSFVKLVENSTEKFIVFEDEDHTQLVLNREDVVKNQKSILKKYNIKADKSDDLLEKTKIAYSKK